MTNLKAIKVPGCVRDAVEHILAAVNGTVFYDAGGNALILGDDHTWIARVTHDTVLAYTEEAYLSTEPIANYVTACEDSYTADDLDALQGFTTGFTC